MSTPFIERLLKPKSGSDKEYCWRLGLIRKSLLENIENDPEDLGQPHGLIRCLIREILLNEAHIANAEGKRQIRS